MFQTWIQQSGYNCKILSIYTFIHSWVAGLCFVCLRAGFSSPRSPPSFSFSLPEAAILECWMWRGEAGTGDERESEKGETGRSEKTLSESPSSSTSENNGIFTDPSQLLSPVKSTQTSRTSPWTSQREWCCVLGGLFQQLKDITGDAVGLPFSPGWR